MFPYLWFSRRSYTKNADSTEDDWKLSLTALNILWDFLEDYMHELHIEDTSHFSFSVCSCTKMFLVKDKSQEMLNLYKREVQLCFISHLTELERCSSDAIRHNKLGSQEPSFGDSLIIQLTLKDDIIFCLVRDTLCVR